MQQPRLLRHLWMMDGASWPQQLLFHPQTKVVKSLLWSIEVRLAKELGHHFSLRPTRSRLQTLIPTVITGLLLVKVSRNCTQEPRTRGQVTSQRRTPASRGAFNRTRTSKECSMLPLAATIRATRAQQGRGLVSWEVKSQMGSIDPRLVTDCSY